MLLNGIICALMIIFVCVAITIITAKLQTKITWKEIFEGFKSLREER